MDNSATLINGEVSSEKLDGSQPDQEECVICLDELETEGIRHFQCLHTNFHETCIKHHIAKSPNHDCPTCRAVLPFNGLNLTTINQLKGFIKSQNISALTLNLIKYNITNEMMEELIQFGIENKKTRSVSALFPMLQSPSLNKTMIYTKQIIKKGITDCFESLLKLTSLTLPEYSNLITYLIKGNHWEMVDIFFQVLDPDMDMQEIAKKAKHPGIDQKKLFETVEKHMSKVKFTNETLYQHLLDYQQIKLTGKFRTNQGIHPLDVVLNCIADTNIVLPEYELILVIRDLATESNPESLNKILSSNLVHFEQMILIFIDLFSFESINTKPIVLAKKFYTFSDILKSRYGIPNHCLRMTMLDITNSQRNLDCFIKKDPNSKLCVDSFNKKNLDQVAVTNIIQYTLIYHSSREELLKLFRSVNEYKSNENRLKKLKYATPKTLESVLELCIQSTSWKCINQVKFHSNPFKNFIHFEPLFLNFYIEMMKTNDQLNMKNELVNFQTYQGLFESFHKVLSHIHAGWMNYLNMQIRSGIRMKDFQIRNLKVLVDYLKKL